MNKSQLVRSDLSHNWHPYTQTKDSETCPPIPIKRAKGLKLYGYDGKIYYDTISSWWCNVHGHGHPEISRAVKKQMDALDHILFAGFTHEPATRLSEELVKIAPRGLTRVFYSDNGSTAVEIAMKMSFQYWKNVKVPGKDKFLSLNMGYHGDTVGTMSVSGVGLFNSVFSPLFFNSYKASAPYCYRCPADKQMGACSIECLVSMEKALKEHAREIAAIVIEPMVLGAGGMIIYPVEYLKGVKKLAQRYKVHLIADEVATGFGRTGKMFACEHAGIVPDFLCLSKGITAGTMPLGVTMTNENVFKAFYGDHAEHKTFFHGHTYTANPVACSAALTSLKIFKKEHTLKNVAVIEKKVKAFLEEISALEIVGDTRGIGAIGAIEVVRDRTSKKCFPGDARAGFEIYKIGLLEGLILRPLGNVIYFFLPLSASKSDLDVIFKKTRKTLDKFVKKISA